MRTIFFARRPLFILALLIAAPAALAAPNNVPAPALRTPVDAAQRVSPAGRFVASWDIFREPHSGKVTQKRLPSPRPVRWLAQVEARTTATQLEQIRRIVREHEADPTLADHVRRAGPAIALHATPATATVIARLPWVHTLAHDGPMLPMLNPLEVTTAAIDVPDVWRGTDSEGLPLTGAGTTICDVDSGVMPFHPSFFRPDGGYYAWTDENANGRMDPETDTVTIDGKAFPISELNAILVDDPHGQVPEARNPEGFQPTLDWLYLDLNSNGQRDFGSAAGFTEDDPAYGEPIFLLDDVDGDLAATPGEKLIRLNTAKIKALWTAGNRKFKRGKDLVKADKLLSIESETAQLGHGTAAMGVLGGGTPRLQAHVGIAPDADLLLASSQGGPSHYEAWEWCDGLGADVILHEYAVIIGQSHLPNGAWSQVLESFSNSGMASVAATGNHGGAEKGFATAIAPGGQIIASLNSRKQLAHHPQFGEYPVGPFRDFYAQFAWTDPNFKPTLEVQLPGGDWTVIDLWANESVEIKSPDGGADVQFVPWVQATGIEVYVFATLNPSAGASFLPEGSWSLRWSDGAAQRTESLPIYGWVYDTQSGWGKGVTWESNVTEDYLVGWPAYEDSVAGLGAYSVSNFKSGSAGRIASYNSGGKSIDGKLQIDALGPDDSITPAYPTDGFPFEGQFAAAYRLFGGTSCGSPHGAGVAALLKQAFPNANSNDILLKLQEGAVSDSFTGTTPNNNAGYGKLNAYRSLTGKNASAGSAPTITAEPVEGSVGESITIRLDVADAEDEADELVVDADLDYDGTFETKITDAKINFKGTTPGTHAIKVRVTDSSARSAETLARVSLSQATGGGAGGDDGTEPADEDRKKTSDRSSDDEKRKGGCAISGFATGSDRKESQEEEGLSLLHFASALALAILSERRRNR